MTTKPAPIEHAPATPGKPRRPPSTEGTEGTEDSVSVTKQRSTLSGPPQGPLANWSQGAAVGLFVLACLATVHVARDFLVPVAAAFFLKLVLTPLVRRLRSWGIPEAFGAAFVISLLLLAGGGIVYQFAAPANNWVERAPNILRQTESRLTDFKESFKNVSRAAEQVEQMTEVDGDSVRQSVSVTGPNLTSLLFQSTRSLVATAVATIVLVYLLLASGDLFLRKTISVVPRLEDKVHAVDLSRELEQSVSRYLLTITSINLSLGIVVGVAMHLLGMPNAMLWGMMVALFNFVPYLGALASFAFLTLAAFVTFDDLSRAFTVGGVFFAINAIEAYFVTPAVVGKRMSMNPVAIFVSVIFLGWAWGVPGMLFAVPILATLRLCCEHIEALAPVGEFLSG